MGHLGFFRDFGLLGCELLTLLALGARAVGSQGERQAADCPSSLEQHSDVL